MPILRRPGTTVIRGLRPILFASVLVATLFACATSGDATLPVKSSRSSADGKLASANVRDAGERSVAGRAPEFRRLPAQGPEFWERMMTREVAFEYRAINGVSQCTRFVADMLQEHFDRDLYSIVFPDGVKGANATFLDWAQNDWLVRLDPDRYSIDDIQELVNDGYLILMAYYYAEIAGHVAFVGNRNLELFTIPPLPALEGKSGSALDATWLPVMVQAGTYTGITSMVYATNGWLRNDNFGSGVVRYYAVRTR
jgi:hypothetical protein